MRLCSLRRRPVFLNIKTLVGFALFLVTLYLYLIGRLTKSRSSYEGLDNTGYPEQIHISFGSNTRSMVVMWATRANVTGVVQYGETADSVQFSTGSNVSQLPVDSIDAAKYIHRVELKNLGEGRTYYYRVVSSHRSGDRTLKSSQYSFKVPNRDLKQSWKFLVYGDFGANKRIPTYEEIERRVMQDEYAAILHVGDFAYDLETDNGLRGDEFLKNIEPFAARLPYMTCPGNHENHGDLEQYRTRFSHPGVPWPIPLNKMWYSFDLGMVHLISYSTEVYFSHRQQYVCAQFDWLRRDLIEANKNRDIRPWIIAIGHRPMYCSNFNIDDCTGLFFRGWVKHGLEDLFHAQGVDLVIEADEHSYERLWPVYNGKVSSFNYNNPRSPTHVISGAAGNREGVNWMSRVNVHQWSAFRADGASEFSFGITEIHNRTHLNFKQISAKSKDTIDSFWLVQEQHGPFVQNVNCTGEGNHRSCYCPFPFLFMLVVMFIVFFLIPVTCVICLLCCYLLLKRDILSTNDSHAQIANTITRFVLGICCLCTKYLDISRRTILRRKCQSQTESETSLVDITDHL